MRNIQKGIAGITILILLVIGFVVYINDGEEKETTSIVQPWSDDPIALEPKLTYHISGNTLSVVVGGIYQTITLDDLAVFALNADPSHHVVPFATDKDLNFDGYNDVIVISSTGYNGVNYFYDIYFYNPKIRKLEKSPILSQISNPKIDIANKTIISSQRSGPEWISSTFKWNGSTYVK